MSKIEDVCMMVGGNIVGEGAVVVTWSVRLSDQNGQQKKGGSSHLFCTNGLFYAILLIWMPIGLNSLTSVGHFLRHAVIVLTWGLLIMTLRLMSVHFTGSIITVDKDNDEGDR